MEKAYFFPRLLAYILDMVVISFIVAVVGIVIPANDNYEALQKENVALQEKYLKQEISTEEFIRQNAYITYDLDYASVMDYIVEITIMIFYFIVFQFYNGGQTLGKKLMGLKVVGMDDKKLTINDYIYRSMVLHSVLVNILVVILVLFMSRDYYFYVSFPLQFIQLVVLLVTIFMVLFRKDGRGLQDMVGHTKVVMVK